MRQEMMGSWDGSGISWTICKQYVFCTSLQTDNHTNTSSLNFYRPMLFLTSNQQRQGTKGKATIMEMHYRTAQSSS